MKLISYEDRHQMMVALADLLAGDMRAALATKDSIGLAVPGGTTPGPIFDALSMVDLPWERVTVMLTDERWVPETSERSNTALLKTRLFQDKAARAGMFSVYSGAAEPEDSLDDLNASIARVLPLSVVLLGMGADMHTASMFPGADGLEAALAEDAPALLAVRGGGAPEPRITLSARVLKDATRVHIVITGDEKRAALERAQTLSPQDAPVATILPFATVHWAP